MTRYITLPAMGATLFLAACTGGPGPITETRQVCAGWAPILISRDDVLTEGTAQQIEGHNLNGVANGCWKRPGKEH